MLVVTCLLSFSLSADEIRVAVASNFTATIKALSKKFEEKSEHKIVLIFGATGRHYAQIINGAPFDIFLAADNERPELLEKEGLIVADSRFTYALGKLVLWSPSKSFVDEEGKVLERGDFYHLAVANPKLAPYGRAAQDVLQNQGHWETLKPKMVRGENIAQTFQFVSSGNAKLGFVALSQILNLEKGEQGSWWNIPESLYNPIKQQAVLLNKNSSTSAFFDFIKSEEGQNIIKAHGYGLSL